LAHGWTSLTIKINIVAVTLLVPAILWIVPRKGALGAAWLWAALNAGYVLFAIQLMHRRLIPHQKRRWYVADVLLPISGAVGVTLLAKQVQPLAYQDRWHWLAFLLLTGVLAAMGSAILASTIRSRIMSLVPQRLSKKPAQAH